MAEHNPENKKSASLMENAEDRFAFKPLAFVLMFMVFVLLFFSVAIMDARRVRDTLFESLAAVGHNIVEAVEADANERYSHLWAQENPLVAYPGGFSETDTRFSLRESLIWRLAEAAREIDQEQERKLFSEDDLRKLAEGENLQAIGVFDAGGRMIVQGGEIPEAALHRADPLFSGAGEIVIDLFDDAGSREPLGMVGLRRKNVEGFILLIAGDEGLRYWSSRVVIGQAIEESGLKRDIVYFMVVDPSNRFMAGGGEMPDSAGPKKTLNTLEFEAPIRIAGAPVGAARVGLDTGRIDDLIRQNRRHIFVSTGFLMVLGLFATGLIYRTQSRSIVRIQAMREKLYRSERLSSLGELAAGVAHEIRNPLNAIGMAAQRLQREYGGAAEGEKDFEKLTGVIRDEIRRLNGIIEGFLGLSRKRLSLRRGSIAALLENVISLIRDEAAGRSIRIDQVCETSGPFVYMDEDKMKQALLNIARNAMDAVDGGGTVCFSIERSGRDHLSIRVHDSGPGISPEHLRQIFNPHFSTKEKGLGLGLPIAYEIVRAHGGDIRVESRPGQGTSFEILLPLERKGYEEA